MTELQITDSLLYWRRAENSIFQLLDMEKKDILVPRSSNLKIHTKQITYNRASVKSTK